MERLDKFIEEKVLEINSALEATLPKVDVCTIHSA